MHFNRNISDFSFQEALKCHTVYCGETLAHSKGCTPLALV